MSDASRATAGLRERLTSSTEDKLGKALADLIDNPLITGTIERAFDARERAVQAQELALGALNIPTAADIERLTRRLRSVSQRLEGIEDGVHRINRALGDASVERRLAAMEEQLKALSAKLAKSAGGERAKSTDAPEGRSGEGASAPRFVTPDPSKPRQGPVRGKSAAGRSAAAAKPKKRPNRSS